MKKILFGLIALMITFEGHSQISGGNAATKSSVLLPSVDNTSDANKPISTATQTGLNLKANQSSISNIDNTSDLNKPISTATQTGLNLKANLISPSFVTPILGVANSASLNITGVAGSGFLQLANQSASPSTPTNSSVLYIDATNRFSWKGTNGFVRNFDGTANTADRSYILPNTSGTISLLESDQTFTGINSFTGANLMVGTTTNAGFRLDVNGTARIATNLTVGQRVTSFDLITSRISQNGNTFRSAGEAQYGVRQQFLSYTNTDANTGSITTPHLSSSGFGVPTFAAINATQTYTNASTIYIDGSPIAGANAIITNAFSLFVNSGNSFFGGKLLLATGANQSVGTATLAAGTITVSNTSVTANSRIFITVSTSSGTRGFLSTSKVAGTSFTITSTSNTDTSVVDFWIIN